MKRLIFYLFFTIAICGVCFAEVTKLSAEHRKVLEDSSRFREIFSKTNLPPKVIALCADGSGKLAEPRQKWEAADVITDESLPQARLIWAAVSGEYCVVHYERGGIGHSFHVLVVTFSKSESKPNVVWHGVGERLKDYSAFLDALRNGKLDDRLDYAH